MARIEVSELARFNTLKPYEQRAVILRNDGKTYPEIKASLIAEFGSKSKANVHHDTIRAWFAPGGRLEQANLEYLEVQANQNLTEAKRLAKRASKAAILTMTELMGSAFEPAIRGQNAARLANKFIPDKQVVLGDAGDDSDLPPELGEEGDEIVSGGSDKPSAEPAPAGNDAPDSPPADSPNGPEPSQAVPESILPEQPAADGPGDPPA